MKKTCTYFTVAALAVAVLAATGCSNSNSSNPPASTNAVSGAMPSTNDMNNPPAAVTNGMSTNNMAPEK